MPRQRRPSEIEARKRRLYRDWLLPRLNGYEKREYFDVESDLDRVSDTKDAIDRIALLPERLVKAFRDYVRGQEDNDPALETTGARTLAQIDTWFSTRGPLLALERETSSGAESPTLAVADPMIWFRLESQHKLDSIVSQLKGDPAYEQLADVFAFFESAEWSDWGQRILSDVAEVLLVLKEWIQHHRASIRFGVCDDPLCERLYVKACGHPNQRFCSSTCRSRARKSKTLD